MPKKKIESKEMLECYSKNMLKKYIKKLKSIFTHYLAMSGKWYTYNKEILMWRNDKKYTVAHCLAMNNLNWVTFKKEILILRGEKDFTVAHDLARYNPNWYTYDKKILKLKNGYKETVALKLALYNPIWCCYNVKLLNKNIKKHCLAKQKYIATRIKKNTITIMPII